MNDFVSILPLAAPLDRDGLRRLAIHACLDLHRVRWMRSYVAKDGQRMLCWYQAKDAESVRLVLRQQGSVQAAVWPAEVVGARADGADGRADELTDDRILVELSLETLEPDGIPAVSRTVAAAFERAGAVVTRTFLTGSGNRLICAVKGWDAAAVATSLSAAGLAPRDVWQCTELDPQPPPLFDAHSRAQPAAPRTTAETSGRAPDGAADGLEAIIIGAGLSGICMLERLTRMGLRARVYESGTDVGGVWHWNRYPGARVDSEVHTYGFSFSDALVRDWEWQELFAAQPEISSYLRHLVDRFGLRPHIRLGARVVTAGYDDHRALWQIETRTGERAAARYLIVAAGTLSTPQLPDYPGMDDFRGTKLPYRALAGSRRGAERQARRRHRHRGLRGSGDPDHRRRGAAAHRLSAHPHVLRSPAQQSADGLGPPADPR